MFRQIFEEEDLLLSFLNAVLEPSVPLVAVQLLNPQLLPRQLDGRTATLDVKATDDRGRVFQIEMQNWNENALRSRMLHTWAELYTRQLSEGQSYRDLQPAISIWLLNQNLFRGAQGFHHRFCVHDPQQNITLSEHLQLHALELDRWRKERESVRSQRSFKGWLDFFSGAEDWINIPDNIASPQLEKAMGILERFRDNREWFELYSSQIDFERRQAAQQAAFEEAQKGLAGAREELQGAREELEDTRGELRGIQAQLTGAQEELDGTKAELDGTRAELDGAKSDLDGTKAELDGAREALQDAQDVLAAANAREARLRALLAAHNIDLDET